MKKLKYTIASSFLIFGLCSCDSFLSHVPDDRTVIDSPDAVKELLVSAYPGGTYIPFCEVMSDNVGDKGEASLKGDIVKNTQSYFWKEHSSLYQDSYNYFWVASYDAIAAANHALEAIEEMGNSEKFNSHRGEALIARAYNHFMLANVFAEHYDPAKNATLLGVPYAVEAEKKVFVDYERETLEKTYELIRKDLEEGLKLIDNSMYDVAAYHFNTDAAYAFASRFYLYTGEWDKVIECANRVLFGDFESKIRKVSTEYFNYDYYTFKRQYSKAEESANLLLASVVSSYPWDFATYRYGLTLPDAMLWFGREATPVCGGKWGYSLYGNEKAANIPKFQDHFKKNSINDDTGLVYMMSVLFNIEEVLFNRAEAYVMTGNYAGALADLSTFLKYRVLEYDPIENELTEEKMEASYKDAKPVLTPFYSLDDRQRTYLNGITDLRRREFIQEGMRWFDVKRFHIEIVRISENGDVEDTLTPDDLRRAVQIPEDALTYGIKPNPRTK